MAAPENSPMFPERPSARAKKWESHLDSSGPVVVERNRLEDHREAEDQNHPSQAIQPRTSKATSCGFRNSIIGWRGALDL